AETLRRNRARKPDAIRAFWAAAKLFGIATDRATASQLARNEQPPQVIPQPPPVTTSVPSTTTTTTTVPPRPIEQQEPVRPPVDTRAIDEAAIRRALDGLAAAYRALDADRVGQLVAGLAPTVPQLKKTFADYRSMSWTLDIIGID